MLRGVRWIGLAVLLAALPALAADEAPKGESKGAKKGAAPIRLRPDPVPRKESKYEPVRTLAGQVRSVDAAGQGLSLEVQTGIGRYARRQTVELTLAEDVIVRTLTPPVQLDENDRPKKYTAEELRQLKGEDRKLPGYTADLTAVARGQVVDVQLGRPKGATKPAGRGKAAEPEPEPLYVTHIVIRTRDPMPSAVPKAKAKDKAARKDSK
jgi:hypothetical protein